MTTQVVNLYVALPAVVTSIGVRKLCQEGAWIFGTRVQESEVYYFLGNLCITIIVLARFIPTIIMKRIQLTYATASAAAHSSPVCIAKYVCV